MELAMQMKATAPDISRLLNWKRFSDKLFGTVRIAEEHRCHPHGADFAMVASAHRPPPGTYVCCECGQQWQRGA
jgi:hypothetical protein